MKLTIGESKKTSRIRVTGQWTGPFLFTMISEMLCVRLGSSNRSLYISDLINKFQLRLMGYRPKGLCVAVTVRRELQCPPSLFAENLVCSHSLEVVTNSNSTDQKQWRCHYSQG